MLKQFKRQKIGRQILLITLGMVVVISLIFFILNFVTFSDILLNC